MAASGGGPSLPRMSPPRVIIAGGGVAGLETLLALRALAGDLADVPLVAPDPEFVLRAATVLEPFEAGEAQRVPLARVAEDAGATLVHGSVRVVLAEGRRVVLASGSTLPYEHLVLAPGVRPQAALAEAITFGLPGSSAALKALVASDPPRIAFVAPTRSGWLVPLYELALLTAPRISGEVVLVTPEPTPLAIFGPEVSAMVAKLLAREEIAFVPGSYDAVAGDPVVSLPLLRGHAPAGVPTDDLGFIPVDSHGRVGGLDDVYVAGDATHHPIKQGGLAAQQADAVAAHLAARLGAPVTPAPFAPVLQGRIIASDSSRALAGSERKLAARHLAPYLETVITAAPSSFPARRSSSAASASSSG
jgi:sulfide:quinone oxidoreductase